jgi:uncharacterized cupin superfamily protein
VVNVEDGEWTEVGNGRTYVARRKQLGAAAGGRKLGCSLYELPPGKRPFPYHLHHVNEEAIYVLDGEGTLRLAGEEVAIRAGDYVALRTGPEGAHQVVNSGRSPLRYLCLSTMEHPEVSEYPETGKVGVFVGSAPGGPTDRVLTGFWRRKETVGYWEGED